MGLKALKSLCLNDSYLFIFKVNSRIYQKICLFILVILTCIFLQTLKRAHTSTGGSLGTTNLNAVALLSNKDATLIIKFSVRR